MEILKLGVTDITPLGGLGQASAGHSFNLQFTVWVTQREMGSFSGEGIDCPELQWKERIEWFGHNSRGWYFTGVNAKDMFASNPTSHTFSNWTKGRYLSATNIPNPTVAGWGPNWSDKDAKHWIAKNGLKWRILLKDVPAMGLAKGSGGGGGESLQKGPSRRRVIYFDLGFKSGRRVQAVQVLETLDGVLQIHKFINRGVEKKDVDSATSLARWRAQVRETGNFSP